MEFLRCVTVVLISSLLLTGVVAQLITTNIDTVEPSVIRSPNPDSGDGFGWAAVFHRLQTVSDTDTMVDSLNRTRIVIGAPMGSYSGGLGLPDPELPAATRTGLVYSCPLGPGDCEGVRGDTSRYIGGSVNDDITNNVQVIAAGNMDFFLQTLSEGRMFDQAPATMGTTTRLVPFLFDRKNGQLMGSFLASSGDQFLACASKWAYSGFENFPSSQPRGICFMGDRNLENFSTLFACRGSGGSSSASGTGYCSSGFSGVLLNGSVSLGAPGDGGFSGAVYSRQNGADTTVTFNLLQNGNSAPNYFGYQIVSGHVRRNDRTQPETDIAVSSPRYDSTTSYRGRVFIYEASASPGNLLPDVLVGSQTSEFFGHSIALVDLTGDGYDELVVGAPMYTTLNPLMPERGRVYIFFNTGGSFDSTPVIFPGVAGYVRYGFTVANAGDLNGDGLEDFVVSAPYEQGMDRSAGQSTGAIYIYYGSVSREAIQNQTPQRIHAETIVGSLSTSAPIQTFGFALSGGVDVDNNMHDDILVGSPDSQVVVVLRSLPFVNVSVSLTSSTPQVNLDVDPSFDIMVSANYSSLNVEDAISVSFTLREIVVGSEPRLFFSPNDQNNDVFSGVLEFSNAGTPTVTTVPVYALTIVSLLDDFRLELQLVDFPRNPIPQGVSGQQQVSDLSKSPRLRLQGTPTISVDVIDPCGNDGCSSDVVLDPITPSPKTLVAGAGTAIDADLDYRNIGSEDGRNLVLVISDIPTAFFSSVSVAATRNGTLTSCTPPEFSRESDFATANCSLIGRLRAAEEIMSRLSFAPTTNFVGNEPDFAIGMDITVDQTGGNVDMNLANNMQRLQFTVTSQSGISVNLEFTESEVEYSLMPIENPQTSGDLGSLVTLRATVFNDGPSIIQNARLVINFPSRIDDTTNSNYFLYPFRLDPAGDLSGAIVNCTDMGLDPANFDSNNDQGGRRRRSAYPTNIAARHASRMARKRAAEAGARRKRQAPADVSLDCDVDETPCDTFVCNISRLAQGRIRIGLDSHVDGRFFGTEASNRTFKLTATASVSVESDFQRNDDQNTIDNLDNDCITLVPAMMVDERDGLLIHAIIWPIIGGVIIFIGLVILLYFVGFFRRKKKPGEDEIEGDFDAPPEVEKSTKLTEKPAGEEGTLM